MMKKGIFKKLSVLLMAVMLALPMLGGLEAYAAAKPSLDAKKLTIGIGSYGHLSKTCLGISKKYGKYRINVVNSKKGASYIFTSSDKTVATVKGEKTTGYITGVKAGTATITVQQKLKGKSTTVGSCKVTVKGATVKATETSKEFLSVGKGTWKYTEYTNPICKIENINPNATYTFKSNSKNFKMSQKLIKSPLWADAYNCWADDSKVYAQTYTAKKAGTYTVTVKETYNKKTKTIGKIKVKVFDNSLLKNEVDLAVGDTLTLQGLVKYHNTLWIVECDEEDILEPGGQDYDPEEGPYVRAIKPGVAKLKYKYDFGKGKAGAQFGVCTVTVKELKVADIELEDETVNVSEYDIGEELYMDYSVITDPEGHYYEGDVTFTSSDEKVVSINSDGKCIVEGLGSATVTITAGDVSKTVTVNVLTDEEYYDF